MIRHRSAQEVKRFDIFKLITLIILALILLVMWLFYRPPATETAETEAPAAGSAPVVTEAPVAEVEPTEEPTGVAQPTAEAEATAAPVESAATVEATEAPAETATEPAEAVTEIAAPTLDVPAAALAPGPVVLSGTGQPGSEVEIVINGEPAGTTTVGQDGSWRLEIELPQAGEYEVTGRSLDAGGQTVAETAPVTLSIAAPEEAAPALALPGLRIPTFSLPSLSLFGSGEETTLSGTGRPGDEVEVLVDGESVGATSVDEDGAWRLTTTLPPAAPDAEVAVRTLDAGGQVVAESKRFGLDLPEFQMPTINWPSLSLFGSGEETTLTGTGEPGADIEVVVDGQSLGTTTVNEDGAWSLPVILPAVKPETSLSVRSLNANNEAVAESGGFAFSLPDFDLFEAGIPTIDLPEFSWFGSGEETTLTGRGEPGSQVEVVIGGEPAGTTTVAEDGSWRLTTLLPAVEPGATISVRALDADGRVVAESEPAALTATGVAMEEAETEPEAATSTVEESSEIEQAETAEPEPAETGVSEEGAITAATPEVEQPGEAAEGEGAPAEGGQAYIVQADDWLSKIANKFFGDPFAYPAIVEATNAKAVEDSTFLVITNPDLIEIGQKLWIPATIE